MSNNKLVLLTMSAGLVMISVSIPHAAISSSDYYQTHVQPYQALDWLASFYEAECGDREDRLTVPTSFEDSEPENSPRRARAKEIFGERKQQDGIVAKLKMFWNSRSGDSRCLVDQYTIYGTPIYITGCVAIDGTVCEEIKIGGTMRSSRCELPGLGYYEGPFNKKSGKPEGKKGILKFLNGDTYDGGFKDGRINGNGKYTQKTLEKSDGTTSDVSYEGKWVRGVKNGKGLLKRSENNGTTVVSEDIEGTAENGLFVGAARVSRRVNTSPEEQISCETNFVSGLMHGEERCDYKNVVSLEKLLPNRSHGEGKNYRVTRARIDGVLDKTAFILGEPTSSVDQPKSMWGKIMVFFQDKFASSGDQLRPMWKIILDGDGEPVEIAGRTILSRSLYDLDPLQGEGARESYGTLASEERYRDRNPYMYKEKLSRKSEGHIAEMVKNGLERIELCNYKGDGSSFTYFPAIRISERYARGYAEGGESVELEPLTVDYGTINRFLVNNPPSVEDNANLAEYYASFRTLMGTLRVAGGSKIESKGLRKYSNALIRDGLIASPVWGFHAEAPNPLVNLVTLANLEDPKSRKRARYQGLMENEPLKESYGSVASLLWSLGIYDPTVSTMEESYIVTSLTPSRETSAIVNLIINIKGLKDVLRKKDGLRYNKLECLKIDEEGTMTMDNMIIDQPLFYAYDPMQIIGYGDLGRIGANIKHNYIEHNYAFINEEKHMNHGNWLSNAAFNVLAVERPELIEGLFVDDPEKVTSSREELERGVVVTMEKMIEKTPGCSISAKATAAEEKKFKNGEIKNVVRSLMFLQNSGVIKRLEEEASEKERKEKNDLRRRWLEEDEEEDEEEDNL
ncbi:MAG: hypothetical protein LBB24_00325 [Rickettsiales bacterium]|jgi:hypothetical protein|nr:hypothetical protein [Rickettsiales bacterium]